MQAKLRKCAHGTSEASAILVARTERDSFRLNHHSSLRIAYPVRIQLAKGPPCGPGQIALVLA